MFLKYFDILEVRNVPLHIASYALRIRVSHSVMDISTQALHSNCAYWKCYNVYPFHGNANQHMQAATCFFKTLLHGVIARNRGLI